MKSLDTLVEVRNLRKFFPIKGGVLKRTVGLVKAVDGVNFTIEEGKTTGLVGESGCGKTTVGLTMLRLLEPTEGEVCFEGRNIFQLNRRELRKLRQDMQIIFQDPFLSLDPRMTAYEIISEPLSILSKTNKAERKKRTLLMMQKTGLRPTDIYKYPHQFSGGEKQRIGIARALVINPRFIIADEPVSSLDVSVRAQILNLVKDLQKEFNLTLLLISHDLNMVRYMCDKIIVMYLGRIVESAGSEELYGSPRHCYTKALLSAIPIPNPEIRRKRIILTGEVPSPIDPPSGCKFHPRCPHVMPICSKVEPKFINVGSSREEHYVACHLVSEKRE